MNKEISEKVICVFCMNIVSDKIDYSQTMICEDCHDYKGITTIGAYILEYGYDEHIASTIAQAGTVML